MNKKWQGHLSVQDQSEWLHNVPQFVISVFFTADNAWGACWSLVPLCTGIVGCIKSDLGNISPSIFLHSAVCLTSPSSILLLIQTYHISPGEWAELALLPSNRDQAAVNWHCVSLITSPLALATFITQSMCG